MTGPLGGQTASVTEQVRGPRGSRVDGPAQVFEGCSLQPDGAPSETQRENRSETVGRWRLFVPALVHASSSAVCTVVPGPVDDEGQPVRLAFAGDPEPWWDENGVLDHTEIALRAVTS